LFTEQTESLNLKGGTQQNYNVHDSFPLLIHYLMLILYTLCLQHLYLVLIILCLYLYRHLREARTWMINKVWKKMCLLWQRAFFYYLRPWKIAAYQTLPQHSTKSFCIYTVWKSAESCLDILILQFKLVTSSSYMRESKN
jgi:hypothetical protein